MKIFLFAIALSFFAMIASAQTPPIEPGVPLELAQWRAAHYSNVRYELELTLEKMAPSLKGKIAIEVEVRSQKSGVREVGARQETGDGSERATNFSLSPFGPNADSSSPITSYSSLPIILDWRQISGHEKLSKIFNVKINGKEAEYEEVNEHLVFRKGIVEGKNRIELDFESPILTSGSAITRYVDKEDGSEYIYSLFVPSDASTAFPVFDQPDLKARFSLKFRLPKEWKLVTNGELELNPLCLLPSQPPKLPDTCQLTAKETKPISTYVFAFAAGPFEVFEEKGDREQETGDGRQETKDRERETADGRQETEDRERETADGRWDMGVPRRGAMSVTPGGGPNLTPEPRSGDRIGTRSGSDGHKTDKQSEFSSQESGMSGPRAEGFSDALSPSPLRIFVRKSQAEKFKQHSAETIRLNREALNYLSDYFGYPFPFPKYDVVLIPEFPFGGMEHSGATFLRETSVIFPTEPTANNYISRASVIFHEAAHQWFGDTVTMKWFDDLWLKEGFATFMAYKAMEKIMPEYDAWKVFYQRVKPAAYSTDVTKGTVPIYQDIPNLSGAKSAYGNIVYQKAPSFLRQAEFFMGEDKFRQAVRSFLKNNEYSNATWSDLVSSFEKASGKDLKAWANAWVKKRSLPIVRLETDELRVYAKAGQPHDNALIYSLTEEDALGEGGKWPLATEILQRFADGRQEVSEYTIDDAGKSEKSGFARYWTYLNSNRDFRPDLPVFVYPNYRDYGYGIFLLDEKSRDYILENIRIEKDVFLRAQMWGSLWDSVRFAELAPLDYINLAIANIDIEDDDTTISSILGRTAYAYTYYLSDKQQDEVATKLEALLIDKMLNGPTVGQRITYYRALLGVAKGERARAALKELFREGDRRQETGDRGNGTTNLSLSNSEVRSQKSEISTRSGSDGHRCDKKSEVGSQESGDGISDMGVPRRGAMPLAPGGAEGGTRGADGNIIPSRFSGDREAGKDARGPIDKPPFPVRAKDLFDIATRLIEIGDPDGAKFLAELEKTEKDDAALRWAYAAQAALATEENKAKFWKDFTENKEISESWIEEAAGAWNSPSQTELTLPYLAKALALLPALKRDRKIFFVNNWLGSFIGGQKSEEALKIVNKFLEDNPGMDADLRRKILENVDGLERAVKIRAKFGGKGN